MITAQDIAAVASPPAGTVADTIVDRMRYSDVPLDWECVPYAWHIMISS